MPVQRIQFRQGTAAEWTSEDTILAAGEPGYETDTGNWKMGDGSTAWTALAYAPGEGGGTVTAADITDSTTVGRAVVTAASASAARTAIGAPATSDLDDLAALHINTDPDDPDGLERNTDPDGHVWSLMTGATVTAARRRLDGALVLNGYPIRQVAEWRTGDPDPTVGGTVALPAQTSWHLFVADLGEVPTWAPVDAKVWLPTAEPAEPPPDPTPTYDWSFDGAGLADESALGAGIAGTGDTPITGLFSAAAPTIETGTGLAGLAQAIEVNASANTPAVYWTRPSSTSRRIGFMLRAPSAWASASHPVMSLKVGTGTGSDRMRIVVGGSAAPGAVRITNNTNVTAYASASGVLALNGWYWIEATINHGTSTATVKVYDGVSGDLILDSGNVVDTYGSDHANVHIGTVASATVNFMVGRIKSNDSDAGPQIGPLL